MEHSGTSVTYEARKATGASVDEFYAAQKKAYKDENDSKWISLVNYSTLTLARVDPMPSYKEFCDWLEDDILALVEECKAANPRHFKTENEGESVDQKKRET